MTILSMRKSMTRGLTAGCLALALTACAATSTAISKRNLDVQSRMSDTIFLDPVAPEDRTVYLEVRNSTDKADFDIETSIEQAIADRGYILVDDPTAAQYILQANVLQAGKNSRSAADDAFGGGFGSTILGGAVGAGAGAVGGAVGGNDTLLIAGGAILGAAAATVADAFVQDVTYTVITDIQVSERAPDGLIIDQEETASVNQGSSGSILQSSVTTSDRKRHRTRVVSTAEKVNLDWPEAAPQLVAGVTRTISGIF